MNIQEWLQIGYFILTIILLFAGLNVARSWVRVKKESNDLKKFELDINCPNNTDVFKILDQLISDTISDYVVLNRSSFNTPDHISSTEEVEMVKNISNIVAQKISPILISKLSIYYSPESISDIIGNKIFIRVTAYVIEVNTVKKE